MGHDDLSATARGDTTYTLGTSLTSTSCAANVAHMRRRRPAYDTVNKQMRGKLDVFLVTQREDKERTWVDIAREIEDRTGLVVDRETVRRWHRDLPKEPAR